MVGTKTEEAGKPTKEEPKVVDEATNEATAAVKKDDTTTTAASTTTTTTTSTTVAPATGTATGAASAAATTTTATTPTLPPMPPIVLKDINGKIVKPDNERKEIPKRKGEVLKRPQDASTVVTRNGKTWDQMFDVLVEYKAKNDGSTQVPDRYKTDDGVCLGLWVRNQRRRKESLTEDQRSRLTELGIDWQTQNERFDNVWHERYAKLTEYRVEHGDCRVPYTYKPDPALAKWVSQQRAQQAQGRLAPERKAKLDAIDFSWKLNTVKNRNTKTEDKKWQRQFEKLQAYKKVHGHCKVPDRYREDKPLGTWVKKQRLANACGQLKEDRKKMLDELGFVWRITDKTDSAKWEGMFQQLKKFQDDHGTCHVSRTVADTDLKPLARWVKTQRALYKSGKILKDREAKLNSINFVWDGTQLPIKRKRRRTSDEGIDDATTAAAKAMAAAAVSPVVVPQKAKAMPALAPPTVTVAASPVVTAAAKKVEAPEAKVVDKAVVTQAEPESADKADTATADNAEGAETPGRRSKRSKIPTQSPKVEEIKEETGGANKRTKKDPTVFV